MPLVLSALCAVTALVGACGAEGEPQTSAQSSTQAVAPPVVHLRFNVTQGNGSRVVTPALPAGVSLTTFVGPVTHPLPLPPGTKLTVTAAAPMKIVQSSTDGGRTKLSPDGRTWTWTWTKEGAAAVQNVDLLVGMNGRLDTPVRRCVTAMANVPGHPQTTRRLCLPVG
jgi:hypothetical protein